MDVTAIVGLDKTQVEESTSHIIPNLTQNKVNIKSSTDIEKVQLINFVGQFMMEQILTGNHIELNTTEMEPGKYFVKIFSHDNLITRKLMIE